MSYQNISTKVNTSLSYNYQNFIIDDGYKDEGYDTMNNICRNYQSHGINKKFWEDDIFEAFGKISQAKDLSTSRKAHKNCGEERVLVEVMGLNPKKF